MAALVQPQSLIVKACTVVSFELSSAEEYVVPVQLGVHLREDNQTPFAAHGTILRCQNPDSLRCAHQGTSQRREMRRGVDLLCFDRVKRKSEMLSRGDERQPRELADRHALEDRIVDRELATPLRFLDTLRPESPTIEIRCGIEHLGESCALCLCDPHSRQCIRAGQNFVQQAGPTVGIRSRPSCEPQLPKTKRALTSAVGAMAELYDRSPACVRVRSDARRRDSSLLLGALVLCARGRCERLPLRDREACAVERRNLPATAARL